MPPVHLRRCFTSISGRSTFTAGLSLVGVLAAFGSSNALATETRARTLQNVGGIQDEVQVFDFPGRLPLHRIALVELGTAASTDVYAAAFVGKAATSGGLAVSRGDWLFSNSRAGTDLSLLDRFETAMTSTANGGAALPTPKRPVELLGAWRLGKDRALGLRIAGASDKAKSATGEGATLRESSALAEQLDMTLGWSGPSGRGSLDVGLTTHLIARQKHTEKAAGVASGTQLKAKPRPQLKARWLADRDGSGAFASFAYWDRKASVETESAVQDKSSDFSESAIVLEGGYAYLLKDDVAKLFAAVDIAQTNSTGPTVSGSGGSSTPSYLTRDEKAEVKALLVNSALSGEADISGGFGTMVGLRYALYGAITEKDDSTGDNAKTETSIDETPDANLWSLGLYYRQAALRVDASYSKAFLHNGPYLVSGAATAPLFGRLSASYEF